MINDPYSKVNNQFAQDISTIARPVVCSRPPVQPRPFPVLCDGYDVMRGALARPPPCLIPSRFGDEIVRITPSRQDIADSKAPFDLGCQTRIPGRLCYPRVGYLESRPARCAYCHPSRLVSRCSAREIIPHQQPTASPVTGLPPTHLTI